MAKKKSDVLDSPSNKINNGINAEAVRGLANLLNETGLTEIEYEAHGCRIRVGKMAITSGTHVIEAPHASSAPIPTHISSPETMDLSSHPGAILAPMVGMAYLSPKPDAPPFVKVGDAVQKDDTLMIIEAMKVMNPIRASKSGTVSKILIENGMPIEYGQALFIIE